MFLSGAENKGSKPSIRQAGLTERVNDMRALFANSSLRLEAGQAVSGVAGDAQSLRIASGRVWITVEGDVSDYWLVAGDSFAMPTGRLVVIEADKAASKLDFSSARRPSAAPALGAQLRQLVQRLLPVKTCASKHAPCASH